MSKGADIPANVAMGALTADATDETREAHANFVANVVFEAFRVDATAVAFEISKGVSLVDFFVIDR